MASLKLCPSEQDTLTGRGYQLLSKIGEGAYAQVKTDNKILNKFNKLQIVCPTLRST